MSTTTPLQALSLMNGSLIHDEAKHLAERAQKMAGPGRDAQVDRLFEIVLGRAPSAEERAMFGKPDATLEAISRVLLNCNEFLYTE